jgi:RNA polymerase sigma-70 factor (ECF subfamily)
MEQFEQAILPHLDAAYNLARWLTGNDTDAQDVVQEASLRALKFFSGFRGGNARAWLLTIVRRTCYTWLGRNRSHVPLTDFDDETREIEDTTTNADTLVARSSDAELVRAALDKLPVEFREVLVWREMEGFSYKEISDAAAIPIGTVMSRLARARKQLQQILIQDSPTGGKP